MREKKRIIYKERNKIRRIVKNVIKFLETKFPRGIEMFNTRNIVGDKMVSIYEKDGIQIDYCYQYRYIEIFGLTETEFKAVQKIL